jgi:MFS family permease
MLGVSVAGDISQGSVSSKTVASSNHASSLATFRELLSHGSDLRWILLCRAFSTAASTGLVPFFVFILIQHFGVSKGISVLVVGLTLLLPRFLGTPVGRITDSWGVKPVLMLSGCVSVVSYLALAFIDGTNWIALFGCLVIQGTGSLGMLIGYRAFIGKMAEDQNLTIHFSWLSTAFNLGYILGAGLAGSLLAVGAYKEVFLLGAALSSISLLVLIPALNAYSERRKTIPQDIPAPVAPGLRTGHEPSLTGYFLNVAITAVLLQLVMLTAAVYFSEIHGSPALVGAFFSLQSLALIFALPFAGAMFRNAGMLALYRAFIFATVVLAAGVFAFAAIPPNNGLPALLVLAFATALSQIIAMPTADATITKLAGRQQLGLAMGRVANCSAIGSMIGMTLAALVLEFSHDTAQLRSLWLASGFCVLLVSATLLFPLRPKTLRTPTEGG